MALDPHTYELEELRQRAEDAEGRADAAEAALTQLRHALGALVKRWNDMGEVLPSDDKYDEAEVAFYACARDLDALRAREEKA